MLLSYLYPWIWLCSSLDVFCATMSIALERHHPIPLLRRQSVGRLPFFVQPETHRYNASVLGV